MLRGTDISGFQSGTVPAGDFVIIKATQGTSYVSGELHAQLADARRKKMLVGFYHFPEFGNDPLADARHFCTVVRPLLQPGDNVILDHEAAKPPSAAHASAWGLKFLPYTEGQCDRRPWVYSNVSWASGGYCAGMGAYPYWCADPSSAVGHPRVRGPFKTWVAHQYSETGGIDHDVFNGSAADWRALGQPHQQEAEMLVGKLTAGKGDKDPILCAPGAFKTLYLGFDNTLALTDPPVTRQAPATFRVAMHQAGRKGSVESKVTVGASLTDTKGWADNVKVTLPAGCDRIDIARLDDGARPVGFCVA